MPKIEISLLALMLVPVGLVLLIQYKWLLDYKEGLLAVARMLAQLIGVGYLLVFVFTSNSALVVTLVLLLMILTSAWIALRTTKEKRLILYPSALVSVSLGGGVILVITTQVVLSLSPWYRAEFIIPLAGMIFASSMNAISLANDRYFDENSLTLDHPTRRKLAFKACMIPVTNSFFAVGLVLLPGMMTGQILSGVEPLVAVRYQILVMAMVFASGGLSSALFLVFIRQLKSI